MLNALFLTIMVDAHVANYAQAKLCNHREPVLQLLTDLIIADKTVKLLNSITIKKGTNTSVTERDIDKGL